MSALYDLFVTPVRKAESSSAPRLHARVVKGKTVTTSTLVDQIADASTFNRGELLGMLSAVSEAMARHLAEGNFYYYHPLAATRILKMLQRSSMALTGVVHL